MSGRSHLICASFSLIGLLGGCQAAAPKTASPANPPPLSAGKATPLAIESPSARNPERTAESEKPLLADPHPTADALAENTQEYARKMEGAMARRAQLASAANSGSAAAKLAVEPSAVQFVDAKRGSPASAPDGPRILDTAVNSSIVPPADPKTLTSTQVASIAPIQPGVLPTVTQTPPRVEVSFNKDTPAVNTPLPFAQPRPLPASDDLAHKFAQQVKDYPQDVAGHLDLQLLQFLQGQSVPQLQSLAPLPAEDRELLTAFFDGLTNFRNAVRADNNMLLSRKIRPLLEVSDRLRTQAELLIPTVSLCTDVKGFGVYDPIEPARFEAGKEAKVIVYCEVENFASILDEQKRWETRLTQEVVLYTEQNGLEVWRDKTPARPIIDYSRNRRHDFFIVKMIRLPANLTIGRYLLKVTVVDQQVNRVAENTVAVQVVAQ